MQIPSFPFTVTDWAGIKATEHPGTTGMALWRTLEIGDVRVRMVEYTPGYLADHWCQRGHILLVLEGELVTELEDGGSVTLRPGMSYEVSNGRSSHRSRTATGAKLFIVD
ncbi:MAG: DHCW motif cupin fold protein [Alphaproteobacteria bacterium]|nr:DHCW motif cupin fold protein [Alphaproteobacteria bacterium]